MEIIPVQSKTDLREFINLPYQLYKNDPIWVAPLRSEQMGQFDPRKNPMLNHCEYFLYLLRDKGKAIGRVSVFLDHLALKHWGEPIGLFGSYECIDDPQASRLLLDSCRDWLRAKGMKFMRGPWSFASQEWGTVVEGYEPSPVILAPYNPPYYNTQLAAFGLEKVKDLLVYYGDGKEGYKIPDRILLLTDKIKKRYGVRIRSVDMKRLEEEVVTIVRMANESLANNWGYYPVTEEEGRAMAHDIKAIVNPKGILIAEREEDGKPIGFAMTLPDVNTILKGLNGRLFPFGWLKLLLGLPRMKQYRMWALGVIPEYHGRAIDSLLYRATYESLFSDDIRIEVNYVLEDNDPMNNALAKLNVKTLRRYRVYQMAI
jgi:ribosomal protein S18 acetylase RimI-like enzyme